MFPIAFDDKDGHILKSVPRWTGDVRWIQDHLYDPMRWKRPRRIFVCSMSDLFHEGVPDEWIDRIFAVMALCPRHTFQCLTKRPGRMRQYLSNSNNLRGRILGIAWELLGHPPWDKYVHEHIMERPFPLPNVWMGVSVEDQETADVRIPYLLQTPAVVRWVSYEPALGPVDFTKFLIVCSEGGIDFAYTRKNMIQWIVCGGESGHNARPMHPEWAREVRDRCASAGVPYFFKQWGEWLPVGEALEQHVNMNKSYRWVECGEHRQAMIRAGKHAAGRLLDGRTWDEYPSV